MSWPRSGNRSGRAGELARAVEQRCLCGRLSLACTVAPGGMWPVAFALKELTAAAEARIVALVKKAVS